MHLDSIKFVLFRGECHATESGLRRGLKASGGDPSERRAVLHKDLHNRQDHWDQLSDRSGIQRGDSRRTKMQGSHTESFMCSIWPWIDFCLAQLIRLVMMTIDVRRPVIQTLSSKILLRSWCDVIFPWPFGELQKGHQNASIKPLQSQYSEMADLIRHPWQ